MDRLEKRLRLGNPMPFDGLNRGQDRETKAEAKHTPGPWEITDYKEAGWVITTPLVNHDFRGICNLPTGNHHYRADDESSANARLIAAAPELLAACQQTIDFVWEELRENPDKEDMDGSIMDRLIELQTTIISATRKVKGE